MAEVNLDKIFASFTLSLDGVVDISELNQIEKEYLGKGSVLSEERAKLASLSNEDKKKYGALLKEFADNVSKKLNNFKEDFEKSYFIEKEKSENPDISIDWFSKKGTKKHILTNVMEEVVDIFASLGYTVAHGPEAETSWHNFDALNTPDWHPARYESDTLYLDKDLKNLLRTQTSTVQVRHMQDNDPPVYIVAPGRVYRSDQLDATHSPVFHQIEGLAVDDGITFSDLKGTLEYFVKEFFGKNVQTKFIPHFFPFTEPSAEVLVSWRDGEWLEILGCGMVDPNVFQNVKYPSTTQGFAFGVGVERLAMLRYGIDHIKHFYENDLRFLEQF
ncbi:phenylalanine--tRNA ligase subunit alpha [Candidatus Actinomarina sp.]|jgi:phenylalanyl-tRNA synthetase alpha chain|nr:phenylalanine--tRNA ligase subunit alpha [Candidatus Actinomarina sp.]MDA9862756.1 phenylalanine--tRNA ligase subunit alpha [Acidimicrobiia bacterium]MDA8667674.1 phenylalanine--tRNA ligase subunit alpha [Candidatus Actinomarina sp.]MDB3983933.1 phenylalanine--tRNA ligase subunit alpha [Acidimicrobiia bacterium]MDB4833419.1 phenylalanine--tRNA ligase subunit alpha [Acidimicrobiia bacterium]|tara:strand:+ start:1551 stop:2543 length:993 start_codon:yes stop_codon:yes gene_type:complete